MKKSLLFILFLLALPLFAQTTVPGWRLHTPLPTSLTGHRTVVLHTGDLLIAGGIDKGGAPTPASYIYSATDGLFRPTLNQLSRPRAYHALVAVPGPGGATRVFAIGGYDGTAGAYRSIASVEVLEYDQAQKNWRWRDAGSLAAARGDCPAEWDGAGQIIVAGGRTQTGGTLHTGSRLASAERIDLVSLAITPIGPMATPRSEGSLARYVDASGATRVLTAGGEEGTTTSTELLAGTVWDTRANPPLLYRSSGATVTDPSGTARVFGGLDQAGAPMNRTEWYDPKSGWKFSPRMQAARARTAATLIAGPRDSVAAYLVAAGQGTTAPIRETEIFRLPDNGNPSGAWEPFASLNRAAAERTLSITGANLPVVIGGDNGGALDGTEIYQPLSANDLVFGVEEVGRLSDSLRVVIRNEWLLPVRIRNVRFGCSVDYVLSGDTTNFILRPEQERSLHVRFRPAGAGERPGCLLIDVGSITDTVRLKGTGVESSIGVVTNGVSFDSVLVDTKRTLCFPALVNRGTDPAVIDSITLPSGAFRLISPIGRATILPGDTLEVCVEFGPHARGLDQVAGGIHLATRTFQVGVSGTGVRRFLLATGSGQCDTVVGRPGESSTIFLTLRNPSDRPVTVSSVTFASSVAGLFSLVDPAIVPMVIVPGETRRVEVRFTPQREGVERGTADFINDGDTAALVPLCFVTRSRSLSPSVAAIDFGTVCAGDTLTRSFILENPGQYEQITVDSVGVAEPGSPVFVEPLTPVTLKPHEYTNVSVTLAAPAAGVVAATIVARGDFGEVTIPVSATVLPSIRFEPQQVAAIPADRIVIPVQVRGGATLSPLRDARLVMQYSRTLLYPRRIVPLAGGPALDEASSRLVVLRPGAAELDVKWQSAVSSDGPAFGIECEVLRGDDAATTIALSGSGSAEYCLADGSATIFVAGPCGGESGYVSGRGVAFLKLAPNPASGHFVATVVTPREGALHFEILDASGRSVERIDAGTHAGTTTSTEISVPSLSSGSYYVRAFVGGVQVDLQSFAIIRR